MQNPPHNKSAFTLAEVVIGIAILSVVLIAITTLTISSIRANQANIHRLTAYYLAQEGIEGLRNVRDSNWLQNHTWNEGGTQFWGDDFDTVGYYLIDYYPSSDSTELNAMPWTLEYLGSDTSSFTEEVTQLYLAEGTTATFYLHDNSNGAFSYEPSFYRRYLYVDYPDPFEDILEVTAYLFWEDYGREKSMEVSAQLTDWKEGPL